MAAGSSNVGASTSTAKPPKAAKAGGQPPKGRLDKKQAAHTAHVKAATSNAQELAKHVASQFVAAVLDTRHIVVIERMFQRETPVMGEDQISSETGMQLKEVNKVMHVLVTVGVVCSHSRNEVKEGGQKASARVYYYIDPIRLVNSLKWRLHKLRHSIDNKTRDEIKTQGYFCPRCKRTYSTLDVGMLAFDEGGFYCDDCHARLDDNENAAERKANKKELERFQTQCRGVIEALRQTEGNVIFPSFNIVEWLEKHRPLAKPTDDGLTVATGGATASRVQIEMKDQASLAADIAQKAVDDAAKRAQNALPDWISSSTVASAAQASRTIAAAVAPSSLPASATLDLASSKRDAAPVATSDPLGEDDEGAAAVVPAASDSVDVAEYYARLAAGPGEDESDEELPAEATVLGKRNRSEGGDEPEVDLKRARAASVPSEPPPEAPAVQVSVAGVLYPLAEVRADEDSFIGRMTEDEYLAYAEIA